MKKDVLDKTQKCDKCQRFAQILHQPLVSLVSILVPWPFAKWGIYIISALPIARAQMKFAIVAIDYFTKWVEVSPIAKISKEKVCDFVWKSIIFRFEIPKSIVTDNALQFNN